KLGSECKLCHQRNVRYDHYHSCTMLRGSLVTDRHRQVLYVLSVIVRLVGWLFWLEPQLYESYNNSKKKQQRKPRPHDYPYSSSTADEEMMDDDHHGIRPDAIVVSSLSKYMIDVSIVNPTSPSYVTTAAAMKKGTPEYREKWKREKYGTLPESQGCVFVPFVLDSYGAMGKEASDFLLELSRSVSVIESKQREFMSFCICAISFALQQGNAFISSAGTLRSYSPANNHYTSPSVALPILISSPPPPPSPSPSSSSSSFTPAPAPTPSLSSSYSSSSASSTSSSPIRPSPSPPPYTPLPILPSTSSSSSLSPPPAPTPALIEAAAQAISDVDKLISYTSLSSRTICTSTTVTAATQSDI